MKSSLSTFALVFAFITTPARGATYSRSDCILGTDFLTKFTFEAVADPSNGRVNYVDEATAVNTGLVSTTSTTFTMGADDTTVLDPNGPGRNSVRIKSTKSYTTHVAVFDVNHMPQGCGTWPAIWETDEDDWPNGGEADIVEGVNDQAPNTVTLHTSPGCTVPSSGRNQTGYVNS
ncbi:glycoside hydrolase family 16 protein [Piloderma croceum F 1598]|uniref:Glycoside hydrolase family 16 protein n=1 Tax=Piloderma croceum (strain F 1598) TaxID=765440 RepID=A0A0C3AEX6_PILCF|nr:glycoside hydrolase family 16 protein [Piloderma croceum F 1598]